MRAVVVTDDRTLEPRDVEEPHPGPGQVRVRVGACGICGSDLHLRPMPDALPAGSVMGHEFAGVVEALGAGVDPSWQGANVAVYPFEPLDRHDLEVAMTTGVGLGARPGGYAESVCVEASMLWRLPEGMSLDDGALVEPLAVALHALNVGGVEAADPCAVIGAGPIGTMTALALRARGVERVVVVEKNGRRRARMEGLGFPTVGLDAVHEAVIAALGGVAPTVVLECAGNPAAPQLAVELVAAGGCVVLVGVLDEPVQISQMLLMVKEGQIRASFAYRPGDFTEAIDLLAAGRVPAADIVTAREPLERAEEMFRALEDPATEHLKVLLKP